MDGFLNKTSDHGNQCWFVLTQARIIPCFNHLEFLVQSDGHASFQT